MDQFRRLAAAVAALLALGALSAIPAWAGNFAEVTIISGAEAPPTVGEEREIRVSLLQHGVTPVDHGTVMVLATLPGTTDTVSAEATSAGGGEWVATISLPAEGEWQLRVAHSVFETSPPTPFPVAAADSWLLPAVPFAGAFLAMLVVVAMMMVLGRRPQTTKAPAPIATRPG